MSYAKSSIFAYLVLTMRYFVLLFLYQAIAEEKRKNGIGQYGVSTKKQAKYGGQILELSVRLENTKGGIVPVLVIKYDGRSTFSLKCVRCYFLWNTKQS